MNYGMALFPPFIKDGPVSPLLKEVMKEVLKLHFLFRDLRVHMKMRVSQGSDRI